MEISYTSKYGKIVKSRSSLPAYWYKGKLIARGSSIASPDYREAPTPEDWDYCVSLRINHHEKRTQRN